MGAEEAEAGRRSSWELTPCPVVNRCPCPEEGRSSGRWHRTTWCQARGHHQFLLRRLLHLLLLLPRCHRPIGCFCCASAPAPLTWHPVCDDDGDERTPRRSETPETRCFLYVLLTRGASHERVDDCPSFRAHDSVRDPILFFSQQYSSEGRAVASLQRFNASKTKCDEKKTVLKRMEAPYLGPPLFHTEHQPRPQHPGGRFVSPPPLRAHTTPHIDDAVRDFPSSQGARSKTEGRQQRR